MMREACNTNWRDGLIELANFEGNNHLQDLDIEENVLF
jgi:hypothetical protein